jgi:hypothetical protein
LKNHNCCNTPLIAPAADIMGVPSFGGPKKPD